MAATESELDYPTKPYQTLSARTSRWKAFKTRFGIIGILTLIVGTLVIIALLIALDLFWRWGIDPANRVENSIWEQLALNGFSEQAVTITSAILRTVVGAQMLMGCYMIASYTLEFAQLKAKDVDMVFVYQAANEGPLTMFTIALKSLFGGNLKLGNAFVFTVFLLLVLTSFASQLFSTILLIDLKPQALANVTETRRIPFLAEARFECMGGEATPRDYPIFAENSTAPTFIPGDSTTPGIYDTGWVHRAFLPLTKAERERIITYDGPANVLTQRDICFPPTINSTGYVNSTFAAPPEIAAYLANAFSDLNYTVADFQKLRGVPRPRRGEAPSSEMALTGLIYRDADNLNTTFPHVSSYLFYHDVLFQPPSSTPFLGYSGEYAKTATSLYTNTTHTYITYCIRRFSWTDLDIKSHFPYLSAHPEPVPTGNRTVSPSTLSYRFNWHTHSIRGLLSRNRTAHPIPTIAATTPIYETRTTELFGPRTGNLVGRSSDGAPHYYCDFSASLGQLKNFCFDIEADFAPARSLAKCSGGSVRSADVVMVSRQLVDLMNDTMVETGHVADAVVAYNTVVHAGTYYLHVPFFQEEGGYAREGRLRMWGEASLPAGRAGFWTVLGLVAAHFGLLAVGMAAYARTESSRGGVSLEGVAMLGRGRRGSEESEGRRESEDSGSGEGLYRRSDGGRRGGMREVRQF